VKSNYIRYNAAKVLGFVAPSGEQEMT